MILPLPCGCRAAAMQLPTTSSSASIAKKASVEKLPLSRKRLNSSRGGALLCSYLRASLQRMCGWVSHMGRRMCDMRCCCCAYMGDSSKKG